MGRFGVAVALPLALGTAGVAAPAAAQAGSGDAPPPVTLFDPPTRTGKAPSRWLARPLAAELHLGAGAPFGAAALAVDWSASQSFSLTLGAGVGLSTAAPQIGLLGRVRLPLASALAIGTEGGFSTGEYDAEHCVGAACATKWRWDHALWGYLGLLLSYRAGSGFLLRGSLGFGAVFNLVDGRCATCERGESPDLWDTTIPYADVAVGWAFAP